MWMYAYIHTYIHTYYHICPFPPSPLVLER